MTDQRLLTIEELASMLQVPKQTVYSWRVRGKGPPGIPVGRYVRYRIADVEKWLDSMADSRTK